MERSCIPELLYGREPFSDQENNKLKLTKTKSLFGVYSNTESDFLPNVNHCDDFCEPF